MLLKIVLTALVLSILLACFLIGAIFIFPKVRTKGLSAAESEQMAKRLTPAAAAAAAEKLRKIEESVQSGKPFGTIRLSQDEINSYIRYAMEQDLPAGISNVFVKLDADRPGGSALVDFDVLKPGLGVYSLPLSMLHGIHTASVDGKLSSAAGYAQFETETVSIGSREMPQAAVDMLYETLLKSRFPNFDVNKPFRLPPEIEKLTVEAGDVLVKSPDQISAAAGQFGQQSAASDGSMEDKVRDKLKSKGLSVPF